MNCFGTITNLVNGDETSKQDCHNTVTTDGTLQADSNSVTNVKLIYETCLFTRR